jgi:hypothetical protein
MKKTIDSCEGIILLSEYNGICIQVINVRSEVVEFSLHKGTTSYLLKSSYGIDVLNRFQAIRILDQLNVLNKQSNFRAFRIVNEEDFSEITEPRFSRAV